MVTVHKNGVPVDFKSFETGNMMLETENEQGYLKQILDNSPDGMFTTDTELVIKYVNHAFCTLLGYEEEELVDTPITNYLGDLSILEACSAEVAKHGKCHDQETIFIRKDGSHIHISKNVQAILNDDGSFKEILVTIRDMTKLHALNKALSDSKQQLEDYTAELEKTLAELRNTQEQLIEAEKMASLGGMVAGVAHEINTPLGVSLTSASGIYDELRTIERFLDEGTLTEGSLNESLEHSKQLYSILYSNLKRAGDLIQNFKQVAVDQTLDEWREINIKEYCDEILLSLKPEIKKTSISVDNNCDAKLAFYTHAGSIYQVISNLVMNSIIHGFDEPKNGNITIKARRNDNSIDIDFYDDGKGIPSDTRKKVFEPFYTTNRGKGGTGLGLSIVYNLVTNSLNGKVKIIDDVVKGTHFSIKLPVVVPV